MFYTVDVRLTFGFWGFGPCLLPGGFVFTDYGTILGVWSKEKKVCTNTGFVYYIRSLYDLDLIVVGVDI